ncbi:MAG TPA: FGGY family carbohydrate kinase [Steroidobacteraceae bacterium]|nr:FGGY family carbohydrate kinase [Steroidobacteraceae bacterium]
MKERLYLALDQGGHASRAIIFNSSGAVLVQCFAPVTTRKPAPDRVEQDPDQIVESLRIAIEDAGGRVPAAAEIVAAGLATQRSSIVCWDRASGAALSPVLSWQDRRNAAFVARLKLHAADIHARTGLVLSPHYGASKLRWCLDNLPAVSEAARTGRLAFGPLSSFLLYRLLEERPLLVDPANASRTQLYDPALRDWSPQLLQLFGVDAANLPMPVGTRHPFGSFRFHGRSVPLEICTGDQSAVPFAFGPARLACAYVNVGTGAFIQAPLEEPTIAAPLLTSVIWSDERRVVYVLEGTINGAGSALEWFVETEGLDAERVLATLTLDASRDLKPLLFLNGVSGLGSPFWVADFVPRFIGEGTVQERFVALLESILFLVRVNLDEMQSAGAKLERIVVTGGLAASDWLCQRLADLLSLPVHRHAELEATARGLGFLVAGQPVDWRSSANVRLFAPAADAQLLERFFAWLKEMKSAVATR